MRLCVEKEIISYFIYIKSSYFTSRIWTLRSLSKMLFNNQNAHFKTLPWNLKYVKMRTCVNVIGDFNEGEDFRKIDFGP